MEVLDHREELGVRVAVISFAPPAGLAAYKRRFGLLEATLLSDAERASYAAFGFDRASLRRVWLDPRVWRRYGQLIARGRRPAVAHEDTLQLGGDVLAGSDGRVHWIHRSRGPEDRPTIAELRAARRRAAQAGAPR